MALYEVQVRIGTNPGNAQVAWHDGMPVTIRHPGLFVSGSDYAAWVQNNVVPPGANIVPPNERKMHIRRKKQIHYLLHPAFNINHAVAISGKTAEQVLADVQRANEFADAVFRVDNYGYDTNWGFEDRKKFALMVFDVNPADVHEMLTEDIDDTVHEYAPRAYRRRRELRVKYEDYFTAGELTLIRDPDVLVDIDRLRTPADLSYLEVVT